MANDPLGALTQPLVGTDQDEDPHTERNAAPLLGKRRSSQAQGKVWPWSPSPQEQESGRDWDLSKILPPARWVTVILPSRPSLPLSLSLVAPHVLLALFCSAQVAIAAVISPPAAIVLVEVKVAGHAGSGVMQTLLLLRRQHDLIGHLLRIHEWGAGHLRDLVLLGVQLINLLLLLIVHLVRKCVVLRLRGIGIAG